MTDPVQVPAEPPEWVIRPTGNVSGVHQGLVPRSQMALMSQTQMDQFTQWSQNKAEVSALTAGEVPVLGSIATGTVNSRTVGVGPPTSVSVSTENMLVSQNFTNSDTVAAQGEWSWDGDDGNITLGCARVDCNGEQNDLVSNEVPVIFGETIEVACQVKWEDIVYTGTKPIILGVEKYRQGRDPETGGVTFLDLGGVDIAWFTSPPANGGWGTDGDLAGTYVVEAGVDQLRFRFRAATTITEGIVKWDEAFFLKLDLIDDAAVPGVGTTVDDIVINLFGSDGEDFTHNEAALALANTSAAITSINARLSATEAEASPGAIAGDDFNFSGEITANANWGGSYTLPSATRGHYQSNGADAVWVPTGITPGSVNQEAKFIWEGTGNVSTTDYQKVQLLLSSAPATGPVATFKSYIRILGRVSSGFGSYVRASIGSDGTYFVDHWNGSAFTVMNSGTCAVPGMGALVTLYCGDKATTLPRHFRLTVNTTVVCDFNEVGTASPLGGSNRGWGWGARAIGGFYLIFIIGATGQGKPPKINQWLGYDQ